ncbi:MAG: hypothetical protein GF417_08720 [Candidatus Latescibacteria bacterium]|nr:hypothetical protein [bacterium]MBD3424504.1 hypothetical protein [Candidatus Latescibacterota bacterium]
MIRNKNDLSRDISTVKGCLDLGSSYFRLLLAETPETGEKPAPRPVFEDNLYIGWGEDIAGHGMVREESLARAVGLFRSILDQSAAHGCPRPAIVGTGTFRKARNRDEILSRLGEVSSLPVRILSSRGEAAYSFRGAASRLPADKRVMLIDLGGTSTELSAGRGGVIDDCIDIGFGTHHLALPHRMKGSRLLIRSIRRRFLSSGGGRIFSGSGIDPGAFDQESGGNGLVLLTGGTAVTLGMIDDLSRGLAPDPGRDSRMDTNLLETLFRRLMELPAMRWPRLLPVTPRRANLLPAGIVLLKFILEWLNINMFTVTARDLRWGIILSGGEVAGRYIFDEQKSADS